MPLMVTALYAGVLGILGVALAFHAGTGRLKQRISLGTADDVGLLIRVRRHGNFTEYVPLALVLLAVLELNGTSATILHLLGSTLLMGRVIHPVGLSMENMNHPLRFLGTLLTMLVLIISAVIAIWQYLTAVM
ncbi:MAG: MAPEG family protein [Pseudomonadales bacterium]|nr:MAPEG family protein [Pseudomonadales bacterium]